MFDYTIVAAQRVWRNIQRLSLTLNIITQICTIFYLVYILIAKIGFLPINISLLAVSCSYFIFYCITARNKKQKDLQRKIKNVTRWTKRLIKLVNLGIMLYAFLSASSRSTMDWVLMGTSLGFWILDIFIEITAILIRSWATLLFEGVKADVSPFINGYNQLIGKEPPTTPTPNKQRQLLESLATERKSQKSEQPPIKITTVLKNIPAFIQTINAQRNHTPSVSEENSISKDE